MPIKSICYILLNLLVFLYLFDFIMVFFASDSAFGVLPARDVFAITV